MAGVSLKKNKIVAIVQARCNSIRLPNKIMRKIAGMPAIEHLYKRLELSKELDKATLQDLNTLLLLESDMMVDAEDAANLVKNKFCEKNAKSNIELTGDGRRLIEKMGLTPKPMKRLKITGSDASELLDKMFSELE